MKTNRIVSRETALSVLAEAGHEYAIVENPSYIHPRYDIYPLPKRVNILQDGIVGTVMDMDGTTTTTEPLCLHSLETMVRRISGKEQDPTWQGLNPKTDYPNIIGNSTTKHVEYLIRTYDSFISLEHLKFFFIYAAAWTLGKGADENRKSEVRNNCIALGVKDLLNESRFCQLMAAPSLDAPEERRAVAQLVQDYGHRIKLETFTDKVRAAVDIYYQRYHYILARIKEGFGDIAAREVFGSSDRYLIHPMPGIGIFLALIKGLLDRYAGFCFDHLADYVLKHGAAESRWQLEQSREILPLLGQYFKQHPISAAVVTSSIFYEADIVLSEVFRVLRKQVDSWDIPQEIRQTILDRFQHYTTYYDAFITATDSSEIRLKPHRDLYCIALHRMGVLPQDFHRVVGFEDSESGVIAIRAAGIPLCCAVPFPETHGHDFSAATYVAKAGIPEVLLIKHVFLPKEYLVAS